MCKYLKKLDLPLLNNHFLDKTPNGQLYTLFEYLSSNKIKENFFVSSADYKFNLSDKNFPNNKTEIKIIFKIIGVADAAANLL